ncbi:cyclin-dependent kinases regulatory subunit-like [Lineus longissimus]|uniref:cyclin-dependent kinases regulatory subunit-like n=1 Tax=Lineus longissimus TaxID=88925 RepID=UPI002B4EC6DA
MSSSKNIYYSEKYFDEEFEYRHVHVPKDLVKQMPRERTMSEDEWRRVGIMQSQGWVHYMVHKPEPNVVLFRRPLTNVTNQGQGGQIQNNKHDKCK